MEKSCSNCSLWSDRGCLILKECECLQNNEYKFWRSVNIKKIKNPFDYQASYYDIGGIEVIDIIKAKLTPEQYEGWLLGNLIKYSCRANWKGVFKRDIEKINNYSKWLKELNEQKDK